MAGCLRPAGLYVGYPSGTARTHLRYGLGASRDKAAPHVRSVGVTHATIRATLNCEHCAATAIAVRPEHGAMHDLLIFARDRARVRTFASLRRDRGRRHRRCRCPRRQHRPASPTRAAARHRKNQRNLDRPKYDPHEVVPEG